VSTDQSLSKKIPHPARVGSLYYLFTFLRAGSFMPFLNVYYAELGLTGQQIGWLASLLPLSMLLFATPIAGLADRKRWRIRLLQIALAGSGAAMFFLQFPTTFSGFVLLIIPMALFNSPIMAIADSLIARMARRDRLNYGGMRLWGSLGYAISAMIFGAFWQRSGFQPMFLIASLLCLPLIWTAGKLQEGPINIRDERKPMGVLFRDAGLVMLLLATLLAAISNGLSMTFEGIYVRSLGGGNFLIGVMVAIAAFTELPAMFYSQRIARKLGGTTTILLAYGFTASAYLGYILVSNPSLLPIFSVLKGLGYGLNLTNVVVMLTERTPDEWASTAQSFLSIVWMGLSPLIAAPLGGLILDAINPAAVFGLGVVAIILAAMVLWLASFLGKLD
jgi:PPP family 3-phenylpropionic acid transporter